MYAACCFKPPKSLQRGQKDTRWVYRTHPEPMQVVSGPIHQPKVHFEAPPSKIVPKEMDRFLNWFNDTGPDGSSIVPPVMRAGIAHLYFVSIHPFEDGNGRIGRAVSEFALSEVLKRPTLIALSRTINQHRNAYYNQLEKNNKSNQITDWLQYFAQTILDAQAQTHQFIVFLIEKTKMLDQVRGKINARQEKCLLHLFEQGLDGFKGGLSAGNYISLTKAARATATRDLTEMVDLGVLLKTGELRHTRYHLNISLPTDFV